MVVGRASPAVRASGRADLCYGSGWPALSGRRRKSKDFSLPANPAPAPLRVLTPRQRQRASEAFLLSALIGMLPWEWQARVDEEAAVELVEAYAPVLPEATTRRLEDGIEDSPDEPDEHDSGAGFALLLATTERLLALPLPATNLSVFEGPPIAARRRGG